MFGRRADGVKVKNLDIIEKATPYFMPMRIDAVQLYTQPVNLDILDEWIQKEKRRSGVHYSYTELFIAAAVRMLYERPKTNRFINDCVIYQRKWISISMAVKQKLTDDSPEETLKFYFTGREGLAQVKEILTKQIEQTKAPKEELHKTTKAAGFLCRLPNWMFKFAMWCFRFMDKHNMLSKKLIDASPFHTSLFVTDVKSIKLDKIYHHLYNFGNTTIFAALGKAKYVPISDRGREVEVQKRMDIGFTLDERVCDGLYYSNSIRLVLKYLENPDLLLEPLPEPGMTKKGRRKAERKQKKAAKKNARQAKKQTKREKKTAKKQK